MGQVSLRRTLVPSGGHETVAQSPDTIHRVEFESRNPSGQILI
jgi:hypothetical protein